MPVISTNNAANASLGYLNNNNRLESGTLAHLASGSRIVAASDDASGLAIGTQLQANVVAFQQDQVNMQQGLSLLQTADAGLAQIGNVLARMMALASASASGQVSDTQRAQDLDTEYQLLSQQINTIASSATYAGQSLLYNSSANTILSEFYLAQEYINAQPQGNLTAQQLAIEAKYAAGYDGLPALTAGTTTVGPFNSGSIASSPYGPTSFLTGTSSANIISVKLGAVNTTTLGLDSSNQTYLDQPSANYGGPVLVTPASPGHPAVYRAPTLADWEANNPGQALLGLVTPASASVVSNIASQSAAMLALDRVNNAIGIVVQERALIGGYESRFNFSAQDISTNIQNLSASVSILLDADVAAAKADLSANSIKTQAAVAAVTQASKMPQELLRLIQS